ncbi:N-acetylmuramidase family protein [Paraburkholderia hospita]|uniref:N-acetylmuramidase family protein n=1 Tax=Paraburkholderia hospita TaxID=169430 RepID=UPI0008A7745C|nr:N-acetylmuramidase family protein [Paraburkholderia hospita]SEH89993.1 Protein of unknown function [Paraburkholderia hospita]
MTAKLTLDDFKRAAADLGVAVAAIRAVASVETRGSGFLADGVRPVILFERHVMRKQLIANTGSRSPSIIQYANPNIVNASTGGYQGGAAEWDRLAEAIKLDRQSALESCSWGAFQIMGYWWKSLGYASVQAFVNAMYSGEPGQLDAFVRFVKANPNLLHALRAQDFAAFAKGYNGPDYAKNKYDTKMADAFTTYSKEHAA